MCHMKSHFLSILEDVSEQPYCYAKGNSKGKWAGVFRLNSEKLGFIFISL